MIADFHTDVLLLTETWHENAESVTLKRVTPDGYKCIDAARPLASHNVHSAEFRNYGGIALVYRDSLRAKQYALDIEPVTFEHLCVNVATDKDSLLLLCVYRPGSQAVTAEFFDELTSVLEEMSVQRRSCIICGDFNIHIDDDNDVHAKKFGELLQTFDLVQHVREPTHTAGHILDVVISRPDTEVQQLSVGSFVSDHAVVNFKLNLRQQATTHPLIVRRRWRNLIAADFEADLAASRLCADLTGLADLSPDDLVDLYDNEMLKLLDKHCPKVMVRQKRCKLTPWFDAECRASRRRVRAAERRYRRRRRDVDKTTWLTRLKLLHVLYEQKNKLYWRAKIDDTQGDSRKLWRTLSSIMGDSKKASHSSGHTADEFATFFAEKVDGVRKSTSSTPLPHVPATAKQELRDWDPVSTEDVAKLISEAPNKSCQLDTAPTWLVKQCNGLLAPFITLLFNTSLRTGCFPTKFKHAVVTPLLKKGSGDDSQLKNYRPVSNLPFLSKLLEKVVQNQLQHHLISNDLMPKFQSAYRQFHSTETAVNKILNDLLLAADQGQVSALCLLDLTAAFDTVDHSLLLTRLQRCFGVEGCCLDWFSSYLSGRSYCVVVDGVSSKVIYIICSVPQGSVLGPVLFVLYVADLSGIVAEYNMSVHAYADDNQLYIHCQPEDAQSAVLSVQQCVSVIEQWMAASRLRLNMDKTELMWTGTTYNVSKIPVCCRSLTLGGAQVVGSDTVRVLGVLLTPDLSLDKHVTAVSAKCFFQLRQLRRIRRSLDDNSAATLIHAFVASRVDYCGSLLIGAPKKTTDKLQRVLNAAARIVSNTRKYDRGLRQFRRRELHWLDVDDRVRFRVCVQVYKCLHNMAPGYLSALCQPVSSVPGRRHLRSAGRGELDFPRVNLSTYGGRAFARAGPTSWNSLPDNLKNVNLSLQTFKRHLKTFFFASY